MKTDGDYRSILRSTAWERINAVFCREIVSELQWLNTGSTRYRLVNSTMQGRKML